VLSLTIVKERIWISHVFTVSESEHRIHNPFTPEKYATLGRVLRMKPDTRILDLGSGSGDALHLGT
jgi:cyclopropane fatty-acyl-phospholipid synthase-like methyltransferase